MDGKQEVAAEEVLIPAREGRKIVISHPINPTP